MLRFSVSIIICTCNRSQALFQTLEAFREITIPDCDVEIIVVDNGSQDNTKAIVHDFHRIGLTIRYLYELKRGKGNALNAAIATARGEVILFTDDDVRPTRNWIESLAAPLVQGTADAVGGTIQLAPHLSRPWLRKEYKLWLAWCETPETEPMELIGANMGIHRRVLERVPKFDPELGPGAAGLGEDTLFSWQLAHAGFRLKFISEAIVVHHPDISRLRRSAWLGMAKSHGRKDAYIFHHWKHQTLALPILRSRWLHLKLIVRRLLQPPVPMDSEGCTRWEMSYVGQIEMYRAYLAERKRPRNYEVGGLVKAGA